MALPATSLLSRWRWYFWDGGLLPWFCSLLNGNTCNPGGIGCSMVHRWKVNQVLSFQWKPWFWFWNEARQAGTGPSPLRSCHTSVTGGCFVFLSRLGTPVYLLVRLSFGRGVGGGNEHDASLPSFSRDPLWRQSDCRLYQKIQTWFFSPSQRKSLSMRAKNSSTHWAYLSIYTYSHLWLSYSPEYIC